MRPIPGFGMRQPLAMLPIVSLAQMGRVGVILTCAGLALWLPIAGGFSGVAGVFLYPGDRRTGYNEGRLRLVYEAAPVAFLVEQAGGSATNGAGAVMDIIPDHLHQRVPFLFGSCTEIDEIVRHYSSSEPPI